MEAFAEIWGLCRSIAELTGLEVTWKDPAGRSLAGGESVCAHVHPFCRAVKAGKNAACVQDENRRIMARAVRGEESFLDVCHAGGVQLVAPIVCGGRFDGVILLGPARRAGDRAPRGVGPELHAQLPLFDEERFVVAGRLVRSVAEKIADATRSASAAADRSGAARDLRIVQACHTIATRPGEALRAADLAAEANLSTSRFLHLFREQVGLSLSAYRKRERMRRAGQLLRYTDLQVSAIAQALGYCHQTYFSAEFKRHEGLSPRAYRQRYQAASPA
ncbi:MAG: helix-turn-helix domain-containing protein [Planctomycetota bacterium]